MVEKSEKELNDLRRKIELYMGTLERITASAEVIYHTTTETRVGKTLFSVSSKNLELADSLIKQIRAIFEAQSKPLPLHSPLLPRTILNNEIVNISIQKNAAVSVKTYGSDDEVRFTYEKTKKGSLDEALYALDEAGIQYKIEDASLSGRWIHIVAIAKDLLGNENKGKKLRSRRLSGTHYDVKAVCEDKTIVRSSLDLIITGKPRILEPHPRSKRSDVFEPNPLLIGDWNSGLHIV